ncbi:acyl-CoA N-acyltransferase [Aspergillus pseudoustus]|uniref:Acyl-CoA N-acyltransferase n=1 Tax=Aspergillus pseudoustus TaxID=1810923 RepID=A0ABR4JUC2_9EURO
MPFHLRRAVATDIGQLADVFFSGFRKDGVMSRCFPEKPSVRQFVLDGLVRDLLDPNVYLVAVVDDSIAGEPIIAYANWVGPRPPQPLEITDDGTNQPSTSSEGLSLYPADGDDPALASFFFTELRKRRERNMAGRTCFYLAALVCHDEHQGRGAGGMLMRYGVDLAEKTKGDIYVEASPPGVPIYKKFGFREIDRLVVLNGTFTELIMLREYVNEQ